MEEIEDPWHSRPIDVHRWSDHPEVVQFVDRVWDDYLPKEVVNGPGPKPKMAFRKPSLMRVEMATFNTKGGKRSFAAFANCLPFWSKTDLHAR